MEKNYTGLEIKATIIRVMEPKTNAYAKTPAEVSLFCRDMADSAQEMFVVLLLNARNRIIDKVLVSLGIADATTVHPREVFRKAIIENASAIIVCHNHPSGRVEPSPEDLRITRQLLDAGKIIGIHILDHVIIGKAEKKGEQDFLSMRENGLLIF